MVLKEVYDKFYKNNKWKYIVYILLYIRVPLRQIGMPHFYGKIIGFSFEKCLKCSEQCFKG